MKNIKAIFLFIGVLAILAFVMAMFEQIIPAGVTLGFALAVYSKACTKNVGGNSAIYITEAANPATIAVTAGEISTLTMGSGKTFHQLQADIDTIIRVEEGEGVGANMKYSHRVEAKFSKPAVALSTLRDAIAGASPCGMLAIVTDGNGTSWLVGYNETDGFERPLRLVQDTFNSGGSPVDEDGQVVGIILGVDTGYIDLPFDSTLGGTITAGTAPFITYA